MGGESSQTTTTTLPGAGQSEAMAREVLARLTGSGEAQMGDLSGLARGEVSLSPQTAALLQEIQRMTMESTRAQARANYEDMANQVQASALDSGIEGSSIEAVNRAVLGRQLQQTLDQSALQGQITTAQQMRAATLEDAGIKMNANQLLLQQILGAAEPLTRLGLQERLAQATTTTKQKQSLGAGLTDMAMMGGQIAAGALTGGASKAATGGLQESMTGLGAGDI